MRRKLPLLLVLLLILLLSAYALADGYSLSREELSLNVRAYESLSITLDGARVRANQAQWSSSDPAVATVDASGRVRAVAPGSAVITAALPDGTILSARLTSLMPVSRVTLAPRSLTLDTGKTEKLAPVIAPEDASDKHIAYSSSKPEIASVSEDGIITAHAPGRAVIRATAHNGKNASVTVTVVQPALGITLPEAEATVFSGRSIRLTAALEPANTTNRRVTYSTSDKTVATVNGNGVVVGRKGGQATITATTSNGLTASCLVTVEEPVKNIRFPSGSQMRLDVQTTAQIEALALPETATDKTLTYESANPAIAAVDPATGLVTGVKAGRTTVTVRATSGRTARLTVTVTQPVTSLTLEQSELSLDRGARANLTVHVEPADATDKRITYTTSDPSVLSVTSRGQVIGRKAGTVIVEATSASGISQRALVTVREPVRSVRFPASRMTLDTGESTAAQAAALPENATDKTLRFASSNPEIATVDEATGRITALKAGRVVITATATNGRAARMTLTVEQPVTSITNASAVTLDAGRSMMVAATVAPADATNKRVTYKSSDKAIATVSAAGQVTGRKAGTAVITATSASGLTALTTVTVTQPVTRVTFPYSSKVLGKY